ncbi:MAG: endonuclease III domain-containing protein [Candidatus Omnitrophota bacterium]|nr:endonuclease III domain-containing protein [Candidatus Omnitrophota bacterium]
MADKSQVALSDRLKRIYKKLYASFGPQGWWPADSPFEVMVGAILTQNTNWLNVEKAIRNLKEKKLLDPLKLYRLPRAGLAGLIRPAGYYNIKAKRLKAFLKFFCGDCRADLQGLKRQDTAALRGKLLAVNGVGPETADSILLYALGKPTFVVDAYTKRIFFRHGLIKEDDQYHQVQNLFMQNLKNEVKLFNEYHALLVKLGKDYCLKNKPRCRICPLR